MKDDDILRGLADASRADREPGAAAGEYLQPLDDAAQDRIAASILALSPAASSTTSAATAATVTSLDAARKKRTRWLAMTALPAAAAAALFAIAGGRTGGSGDGASVLPAYSVSVLGASELRGGDAPSDGTTAVRVLPTSTIEMVMRPARATSSAVETTAHLLRDGKVRSWVSAPPITRSPDGAVRLRARVDTLIPNEAGRYEIVMVVAPEHESPTVEEALRGGEGAKFRVARAAVELVPSAE